MCVTFTFTKVIFERDSFTFTRVWLLVLSVPAQVWERAVHLYCGQSLMQRLSQRYILEPGRCSWWTQSCWAENGADGHKRRRFILTVINRIHQPSHIQTCWSRTSCNFLLILSRNLWTLSLLISWVHVWAAPCSELWVLQQTVTYSVKAELLIQLLSNRVQAPKCNQSIFLSSRCVCRAWCALIGPHQSADAGK